MASWRPYHSFNSKPVVILVGWLGSQLRHFAKYEELWRGLGASTIGIRPTILQTAIPAYADRALLRFMADVNKFYGAHCLTHGRAEPLLVHTLSNAGWMGFGTMLHLTSLLDALHWPAGPGPAEDDGYGGFLPGSPSSSSSSTAHVWPPPPPGRGSPGQRHPYLQDPATLATLTAFRQTLGYVQGIVVDSAPSQLSPHIWSRGVLSAALGRQAAGIDQHYPLAVRALQGLTKAYLRVPPVERRYAEIVRAWQQSAPACPQLYLYSESDALIPAEDVRAWMHAQRDRGVSVQSRCWADSGHCEHLKTHPQEYRQLAEDFLDNCVSRGGLGRRRSVRSSSAAPEASAAAGA